jgi:aspartokinase/homoserine dehydrogenase 1
MMFGDRRIDLASWSQDYEGSAVNLDLDIFEQHINPDHLPHAVIIDCTADESVAARYAGWLERGIHVITPNKKAFSSAYKDYEALQAAADEGSSHYFYETTVGAGLPIISTLCDLIYTGDEIRSIRGIFSGTLAYLFNVYNGSEPFSEIVRAAKKSGYTEPDPRDDLSGMDVARKLTILARELGQRVQIGDFPVQNLVPEALRDCSVEIDSRNMTRRSTPCTNRQPQRTCSFDTSRCWMPMALRPSGWRPLTLNIHSAISI